jgi:nicotinamide-nucleotide amidase
MIRLMKFALASMNIFSADSSSIYSEQNHTRLIELVNELSSILLERHLKMVTVESCTGGQVAALCTDFAGSSAWFDRGFVTYSDQSKIEMVGVKPSTLARHGAVSKSVAAEMAIGGIAHSDAQLALSITGIAGPGGGSERKPVGTVCFGWAGLSAQARTLQKHFPGDRKAVRAQSVIFALTEARKQLEL